MHKIRFKIQHQLNTELIKKALTIKVGEHETK